MTAKQTQAAITHYSLLKLQTNGSQTLHCHGAWAGVQGRPSFPLFACRPALFILTVRENGGGVTEWCMSFDCLALCLYMYC